MPYHNLARAHRRLMAELPADSPYRLTESPSLTSSLLDLWRRSRAAGRGAKPFEESVRTPHLSGTGQGLHSAH
jgi:fatty acid desaturase